MHLIKALPIIAVVVVSQNHKPGYQNAYIDEWDAQTDWTPYFGPCRSHFMYDFTPCEPKTKMLACCRRFNPFVLFLLMIFSIIAIAAVPVLLLCCICPPFRVLCECCLCCESCAIDENGNFIHFKEEEDRITEEFDIKTNDYTTTGSRMDSIAKSVIGK
uniref:Caveolin n=1 Tax=Onchocerca volvulus TaxID=6282 RepID=A0A8R1XMV3_ONCVO